MQWFEILAHLPIQGIHQLQERREFAGPDIEDLPRDLVGGRLGGFDQGLHHVEHKHEIASLLSIIARRDASITPKGKPGPIVFDLPLTREAMADYLGLTLETVSRQISALKKEGIIELEGKRHVTIPDMRRLMEEAGDDSDGGFLN